LQKKKKWSLRTRSQTKKVHGKRDGCSLSGFGFVFGSVWENGSQHISISESLKNGWGHLCLLSGDKWRKKESCCSDITW
jgi:hypothetical protein